jgi:hypothetical protein
MKLFSTKTAAIALAIPGLALATPALAASPGIASQNAPAVTHSSVLADVTVEHKRRKHRGHAHGRRYDQRDYRYRQNQRPRSYGEPIYRDTRIWRARDGQYYCRKENGTTGLLVGAAVGGLIGNEVAGRGDRTLGAILGAAGGAILGRSIDRSNSRCR